jgi:hypothetical protein
MGYLPPALLEGGSSGAAILGRNVSPRIVMIKKGCGTKVL